MPHLLPIIPFEAGRGAPQCGGAGTTLTRPREHELDLDRDRDRDGEREGDREREIDRARLGLEVFPLVRLCSLRLLCLDAFRETIETVSASDKHSPLDDDEESSSTVTLTGVSSSELGVEARCFRLGTSSKPLRLM